MYNTSWYGSVLWDLFSPAAVRLESSWNRSLKVMLDLPHETQRCLMEPLSWRRHIRKVFISWFLNMINRIKISKKPLLKNLLRVKQHRTTSTIGKNLRKIMLLQGVNHIEEIKVVKDIPYSEEEAWKVDSCRAWWRRGRLGSSTGTRWTPSTFYVLTNYYPYHNVSSDTQTITE